MTKLQGLTKCELVRDELCKLIDEREMRERETMGTWHVLVGQLHNNYSSGKPHISHMKRCYSEPTRLWDVCSTGTVQRQKRSLFVGFDALETAHIVLCEMSDFLVRAYPHVVPLCFSLHRPCSVHLTERKRLVDPNSLRKVQQNLTLPPRYHLASWLKQSAIDGWLHFFS